MTALLQFDDVTIRYPIYNNRNMSLRNQLVRISTGGRIESEAGHVQTVTALRNVSFIINHGDSVGLIGHNGAGKSTMLRTMAGVYTPISGKVIRDGRVATVLELGTGMDPELSGYENIVRMSMLLGMNKEQIEENASRRIYSVRRLPSTACPHLFFRHGYTPDVCRGNLNQARHPAGR